MSEPWRRSRQTWWRRPSVVTVKQAEGIVEKGELTLGYRKEESVVQTGT